jgi:hypothetical protein
MLKTEKEVGVMYRSVISLFILVVLVGWAISINPQAREEATELWEEAKPTVVAWKDKVVEVFQGLINSGTDAQIEHEPGSPELNIDLISAFNDRGSSLQVICAVST